MAVIGDIDVRRCLWTTLMTDTFNQILPLFISRKIKVINLHMAYQLKHLIYISKWSYTETAGAKKKHQ